MAIRCQIKFAGVIGCNGAVFFPYGLRFTHVSQLLIKSEMSARILGQIYLAAIRSNTFKSPKWPAANLWSWNRSITRRRIERGTTILPFIAIRPSAIRYSPLQPVKTDWQYASLYWCALINSFSEGNREIDIAQMVKAELLIVALIWIRLKVSAF